MFVQMLLVDRLKDVWNNGVIWVLYNVENSHSIDLFFPYYLMNLSVPVTWADKNHAEYFVDWKYDDIFVSYNAPCLSKKEVLFF